MREALVDALAALDAQLPWRVPVIIAGERRDAPSLYSADPGVPERIVAEATAATPADVDAAVAAAAAAAPAWEARGARARAAILSRAAGELRRRRPLLAALAVRECAKPWAEADGDVCEAIDFLEYYAQQAVALESSNGLVQLPGERNTLRYAARGVVAVIGPWNFPFAIPAGMVAAGLATGNGVVLKPAEQSPACALAVVEALHAAGVPPAALSFLPGEGDVGAALVGHPGVHTIAFTGSGAVGLEILRRSAELAPGQRHLKRVVAEMGGKNCIIVDADADLDDAVPALAYSAFGFAGQKCSAAARALVHERIADTLLERLHGAVEALLVDQAQRFGVDVPPVIEQASRERIERYLEIARSEGGRVFQPGSAPEGGWFVAARGDRSPAARLARHRGGDLRAGARRRARRERRRGVRDRLRAAVRAHRRAVLARSRHRRAGERVPARRQPLRQPPHHGRDGRPPAVRRQPAVRHRHQGGRPGLPAALRRAARRDRGHDAPRAGGLSHDPPWRPACRRSLTR